jgi:hypothetical protein
MSSHCFSDNGDLFGTIIAYFLTFGDGFLTFGDRFLAAVFLLPAALPPPPLPDDPDDIFSLLKFPPWC